MKDGAAPDELVFISGIAYKKGIIKFNKNNEL